jgi:hypothetical protein
MEKALKYSRMVLNIKVNGEIINSTGTENFIMLTETFIKESGQITKQTASVSNDLKMDPTI